MGLSRVQDECLKRLFPHTLWYWDTFSWYKCSKDLIGICLLKQGSSNNSDGTIKRKHWLIHYNRKEFSHILLDLIDIQSRKQVLYHHVCFTNDETNVQRLGSGETWEVENCIDSPNSWHPTQDFPYHYTGSSKDILPTNMHFSNQICVKCLTNGKLSLDRYS